MSDPCCALPEDILAELHELCAASLGGELSDEQASRLDQLVCEDENVRKLYIRYMYVSWNLRTWARFPLADDVDGELAPPILDAGAISQAYSTGWNGESPHASAVGSLVPPFPGTTGYIASGWPVAYLIATVVLGVGLLVTSLISISPLPESTRASPRRKTVWTVDCEFGRKDRRTNHRHGGLQMGSGGRG